MQITLYKMNSSFQILFWTVKAEGCTLEVEWGTMDETSAGPKMPQRANSRQTTSETFPDEYNCLDKANSLAREKVSRKGYTTTIPKTQPLLPMLAETYNGELRFEKFAVQPKLDGYRCIGTKKELRSRLNSIINSVPHINDALQSLPEGVRLDGELYIHGVDLQTIGSYVKRNSPHELGHLIDYYVYDLVAQDMSFEDRYDSLTTIYNDCFKKYCQHETARHCVHLVPTSFCNVNEIPDESTISKELKKHHAAAVSDGFEGLIIRDCEGIYELNKRSKSLLKYKAFIDGEFEIVNVEEAKEGCAVLVIKTGRTTTDVAIKTSKLNKQGIWHNRERQIGRWAKVKYTKVLPTDKLFQPVCIEIYEKKEDAK